MRSLSDREAVPEFRIMTVYAVSPQSGVSRRSSCLSATTGIRGLVCRVRDGSILAPFSQAEKCPEPWEDPTNGSTLGLYSQNWRFHFLDPPRALGNPTLQLPGDVREEVRTVTAAQRPGAPRCWPEART